MEKTLLTVCAVIFLIALSAQSSKSQSKITGSVIDAQGKPVPAANVILLHSKDSAMVKGMVTTGGGSYAFENIPAGKYLITSTFLGHKQVYSPVFEVGNEKNVVAVKPLTLTESGTQLKEVVVSAKKPLYEQKIDRMVINVKNSIVSAGGTALDVLERSPGVMVDRQNNSLSMGGKDGVVVMINGKVSHMPLSSVVQMLAGMTSDNIEKIELITTPPAKLDAEGNAGFINIILVSNPNAGTNGTYSLSMGYGKGETSLGSLNVNHRNKKVSLYADYSFQRTHQPQYIRSYRLVRNGEKTIENFSNSDRDPVRTVHNSRIGIDYQVSKKTVLGALFSGYRDRFSMDAINRVRIMENDQLDTSLNIVNDEINRWKNASANLNVQHTFKESEVFSANFDYLYYHDKNPTNYLNSYFDGEGNFLFDTQTRSGKITPLNMWVGKTDFSRKLGKKVDWEIGAKGGLYKFTNEVAVESFLNNNWSPDPGLSAKYNLEEKILAAYSSFSVNLNSKMDMKVGLRYEHTNSNLGSISQKNIVDRQYGTLFPSFFLSRKLGEHRSVNLSYSRRITRPTFNDMAPFVIFLDPKTFFSGNAALQPSISNSVKAAYSYKRYLFSLGYSYDDSPIARFQTRIDSVNNRQITAAENMENMKTLSATFSLPIEVASWWNMQNNLTGRWQQVNALYNEAPIRLEQKNFQIVSTQNIKLPKSFSMEVTAFYWSASIFGKAIIKPFGFVNLGFQKKANQQRDTWSFNISDVLNTGAFTGYSLVPEQNLNTSFWGRFSQRTFKITYSHNFGNDKLKGKRDRNTASEEERGRVNQ